MQSDTTSELHVCFKRSYDEVLRHHHSFIIRSVVSVSLLFPWLKDTNPLSFGLSDLNNHLIVITLANLLLFSFYYSHFILWFGSFPFSPPWFSVVHHARLLNQPRANYPFEFVVHDQLPASCWLIPINEWNGKTTDIWNDLNQLTGTTLNSICRTQTFLLYNQVAIRAVPRRNEFYMRIAQGGSIEKLDVELGKWLCGLESIVKHVSVFLERGGFGKV